jgi:two-component system LytT family response regulator
VTPRIRALVVDDEPAARAAIRALLADDTDIHIVGECADGRAALDAIRREAPDLLFLDIQMPEMDGFTLLRRLDPAEIPVVLFVTAYDQYALRAFEVHALDYLLKPFDDERFREAVAHAKQQVRQGKLGALSGQLAALLEGMGRPPAVTSNGQYLKRLAIKAGGRVTILGVKDIDWIEAEGDYVKIHAGRAWHLLRETMKHLETQFDPARFVRIHRSTIVNVERIKELQPYFRGEYVVILQDGTSLKLSRGYKEHLEAALGRSF